MKKWILNKDVYKILRMYSVVNGEFEKYGKTDYTYKSKLINGYHISISQEFNGNYKTGRIIVSHSKSNGKYMYFDIWIRDENNALIFESRNLKKVPPAEADVIQELKKENKELKEAGRKIQQDFEETSAQLRHLSEKNQILNYDTFSESADIKNRYDQLKEKYDKLINEINEYKIKQTASQNLINDTESKTAALKNQLSELNVKYQTLENKYNNLINENEANKQIKNPRGAGRKKMTEKELNDMAEKINSLLEKKISPEEIQKKLKISRATYFRYKRILKNKL